MKNFTVHQSNLRTQRIKNLNFKIQFQRIIHLLVLIIFLLFTAHPTFALDFHKAQKWPQKGPWFEGWYMRLTDVQNKRSFAIITTSYTNDTQNVIDKNNLKGYTAFLIDDELNLKSPYVIENFPEQTQLNEFWVQPSQSMMVIDSKLDRDSLNLGFDNGTFINMQFSDHKSWSANAKWWGPSGFTTLIPRFPLQWFVVSLGTKTKYRINIPEKNLVLEGEGYTHIEKNWGKMFPKAWIWLQGTSESNEEHIAAAGGPLQLGPLWMNTYLVGYKSKKLDVEFHVGQGLDTEYSSQILGCRGELSLHSRNSEYSMLIQAKAPRDSFVFLSTPDKNQYKKNNAIESFQTEIVVSIRKKGQLIERTVFKNAALEFGGAFMDCK
jgi:hypothetical protein